MSLKDAAATIKAASPPVQSPQFNNGGNPQSVVLNQILDAIRAGKDFLAALENTAPDLRDYQTLRPEAFISARAQHGDRMTRLSSVIRELEFIALTVSDVTDKP